MTISNIEPKNVLTIFEKICMIPHGSYHTDKIADFVVSFAKERGLECTRDASNNIVIRKKASRDCKSNSTVMIQGHLDMVCAKDSDVDIDFENEGLSLNYDGKYIYASGTTLGGDDGIAVAMALAILDSNDISHPALECVFTTDEEVGMLGATAMDMTNLKSDYLLNIDSEDEGQFTVSCAGGETLVAKVPISKSEKFFNHSLKVEINGLVGGHSGVEINKGRANAIILMGKLLGEISKEIDIELSYIDGGQKDNAIAFECTAVINTNDIDKFNKISENFTKSAKDEYSSVEKDLNISIEEIDLKQGLNSNVIEVISNVTNGVRKMSSDIDGLVQTSSNLGIIRTKEDAIEITFSLRSSIKEEKVALHNEISKLVKSNGGSTSSFGEYPAWEYKKDSKLREACKKVYEKQYGEEPEIVAIHAGLECGIFSDRIKGIDCVSYGPNLLDIHTSKERMDVESVKRVFEFTKNLLKEL